ncbi:MAG: serine/threonine protein kinase [Deltaproteobacteria bacterium]|nr:serine/threonine protein kinase [Deltaproteobacteria bacterium]
MVAVGALLDRRYALTSVLGEGGMGTVFEATDTAEGTRVAIKTLRRDLAADPLLRERFEREARALFALAHPHVVEVLDFGIDQGVAYIATELLVGRPLSDAIDGGPLDPRLATLWARQLLSALASAHAQGVAHRDLKPDNVFLTRGPGGLEIVKLLDFGLVRFVDSEQWGASATLTTDGEVMGSPGYISPEQACGGRADATSDVYSVGCMIFELYTGNWPFEEDTQVKLFRAHLLKKAPRMHESRPGLNVSPPLQNLVDRAMQKTRADRYQDAVGLLSAFDALPQPAAWLD